MNTEKTEITAFVAFFEVIEEYIYLSESLIQQKILALHILLKTIIGNIKSEEDASIITLHEEGVIITIFNDGKQLFDIILAFYVELKQYNEARSATEFLSARIGVDCAKLPNLFSQTSTHLRESLLAIATAKAQKLVSFGDAGHILISEDFQRNILTRSLFAKYISYFGRYRSRGIHEVAIWGFYDPSRQIGNPIAPSAERIEDEKGIPIYYPPYIKLCKPRIASPAKSQELATREAKILVLSPHPNDLPWGCAGTLMWLREKFNARIYLHFLTSTRAPHVMGDARYGPPSRALGPALWSYSILTGKNSVELLKELAGLSQEDAIHKIMSKIPRLARTPHQLYIEGHILDTTLDKPPLPPEGMFSDGYMDKYPNILRDRISWLQSQIAPDIVLSPSLKDIHQDHRATAEAAISVFKLQESIWFYELPQSSRNPFYYFSPNLFIDVNVYAERKLTLLRNCFEYDIKRFHFSPEGAQALMQTRAIEAYYEPSGWSEVVPHTLPYVEAFETRLYLQ